MLNYLIVVFQKSYCYRCDDSSRFCSGIVVVADFAWEEFTVDAYVDFSGLLLCAIAECD